MLSKLLPSHGNAYSVNSGSTWYLDSACCNHMTRDTSLFSSKQHTQASIQIADSSLMPVNYKGTVTTSSFSLPETFYVPKLALNLVSIGQLVEQGIDVSFSITGCRL